MFLKDGLDKFEVYPIHAAVLLGAAALFVWMYIAVWQMRRRTEEDRLGRLRESVRLFTDAEHALWLQLYRTPDQASGPHLSPDEEDNASGDSPASRPFTDDFSGQLTACLAAPYISADLRFQISAYERDPDPARLGPLHRIISREAARLADEYEELLGACEQPGWGRSIWRQLRPALPFVFLAAAALLCTWLAQTLYDLPPSYEQGYRVGLIRSLAVFLSGLLSLLMFGRALLSERRFSPSGLLQRGWALLIGLLFLIHLAGLRFAPYVLVLQLLLLFFGFIWTDKEPRRNRPFVGHYEGRGGSEQPEDAGHAADEDTGRNPE